MKPSDTDWAFKPDDVSVEVVWQRNPDGSLTPLYANVSPKEKDVTKEDSVPAQ